MQSSNIQNSYVFGHVFTVQSITLINLRWLVNCTLRHTKSCRSLKPNTVYVYQIYVVCKRIVCG